MPRTTLAFDEIRADEYSVAEEAAKIGEAVIAEWPDVHGHLAGVEIGYLFRDDEVRDRETKVVVASAHLVAQLIAGAGAKYFGRFAKWALQKELGFLPTFLILIDRNLWAGFDELEKKYCIDHELCFPANVSVTGPAVKASSIRRYAGKVITITTAAGDLLTGTPNHPVLTSRGWVPLQLVKEGDDVVRCADPERVSVAMSPNEYQVPTSIEKVARACRVPLLRGLVPESAEDLYPKRADRQIDVVFTDGRLLAQMKAAILQHIAHQDLKRRDRVQVFGASMRHLFERLAAVLLPLPYALSFTQVGPASLSLSGIGEPRVLSARSIPRDDTVFEKDAPDHRSADSQFFLERVLGSAPGVTLEKVVSSVEIPSYEGHVYNLETTQGWYVANGIIAHNCHCIQKVDDDGCPRFNQQTGEPVWGIKPHDMEEFEGAIRRNGLVTETHRSMAAVMVDAALRDAEDLAPPVPIRRKA